MRSERVLVAAAQEEEFDATWEVTEKGALFSRSWVLWPRFCGCMGKKWVRKCFRDPRI